MERLMLLDGNGLIYRGYFALPPADHVDGASWSTRVFGFCSIVLRGLPGHPAGLRRGRRSTCPVRRSATSASPSTRPPGSACRTTCATSSRRSARSSRRSASRSTSCRATRPTTSSATLTVQAERRGLDTTIVTGDLDMLQLVTDRTRLMTTRSGVQNTIIYDPARIRRAVRPAARPDDRLQGAQGRLDRQHPRASPGVGEKTAAKLIQTFGDPRGPVRAHRRGHAGASSAAALLEARDRVLESRELMTILRDLPVELDLDAARLGDYDRERRHPPVPRVRVPDPHRAAAGAEPASARTRPSRRCGRPTAAIRSGPPRSPAGRRAGARRRPAPRPGDRSAAR